jgi:hypothetical protein
MTRLSRSEASSSTTSTFLPPLSPWDDTPTIEFPSFAFTGSLP